MGALNFPNNGKPLAELAEFFRERGRRLCGSASPRQSYQPLRGAFMAKILQFPSYQSIRIKQRRDHHVVIRVIDRVHAERTRWRAQYAVQRAASFKALKGFTDRAARRGQSHSFVIRGSRRTRRFLDDVRWLIVNRRIEVEVDGRTIVFVRKTIAA
jgi:hypothetical protein